VPIEFLLALAAVSAGLILLIGTFAARARARPVVSGREELPGSLGTVTAVTADGAWAQIHGESWRIEAPGPVAPGDRVRVLAISGLTLRVERLAPDTDTRTDTATRSTT
jgi:membrane-bound serine protease (ClpP class)